MGNCRGFLSILLGARWGWESLGVYRGVGCCGRMMWFIIVYSFFGFVGSSGVGMVGDILGDRGVA